MTPSRLLLERVLPIGILVMAIVAVPVMILSPQGLSRLERLKGERDQAEEQISRLSQQIRELQAEVEEIRENPQAVERAARDELGLIRQTEVVFQFED